MQWKKKPHCIIPEVQAEGISKGNTHGLIMNIYLKRKYQGDLKTKELLLGMQVRMIVIQLESLE